MTDFDKIFQEIWHQPENEVVEFKEAKENFDIDDLGRYFSALSNEANLRGVDFAWIVFGATDKKREIVGTNFKRGADALNKLKNDMATHTTGNHIFRDIVELTVEGKRVLLFQIPASPRNMIMCWKGIPYARVGQSLKPLSQGKQDEIRNQSPKRDWSAEIVPNATMADLDEVAIAQARQQFAKVHQTRYSAEEIAGWSVEEFLHESGVMYDGALTRAALILLGKPSAMYKLKPAVIQITWVLNDEEGEVIDYEHFTAPYVLTVDRILAKVRNLAMREMPGGTLFPDIERQYDDYTMREALHNCIAHTDYRLEQRITLIENPGTLCYENGASFIPGTIEDVLKHKGPQRYYRNKCLCDAMVHFNMIDTVGRGIKKMYREQRNRFFPMPDYKIDSDNKEVVVTIYGKSLNDRYTQLLRQNPHLGLKECIWLDAIQKRNPVTPDAIKELKSKHLIEGRKDNYTISLNVAQATDQVNDYTKLTGLNRTKIKQMALQYIQNAGQKGARRGDILEYLREALPGKNSDSQNNRLMGNLLSEIEGEGGIILKGKTWYAQKTKE